MSRLTKKINETDYKLTKYNDIVRANARMKLGKLEDFLEKYGIPSLEYLEKCVRDHDKYGESREQLGCPLEVIIRVLVNNEIILVQNPITKSIQEIPNPYKFYVPSKKAFDIRCENFEDTYRNHIWDTGGVYFYLKDYKKAWWLKEDKSE